MAKTSLAVHVTEYGKAHFSASTRCVRLVLRCNNNSINSRKNIQRRRQLILIYIEFTFTRVSLRALKDNIQHGVPAVIVFKQPIEIG